MNRRICFKNRRINGRKKYEEATKLLGDNYKKDSFEDNLMFIRINISQGKFEQALINANIANKLSEGKNYEILYFLGIIYDNLLQKDKAKEYVIKSLEIKPDFKLAKEYLEELSKNNIEKKEYL